MRKPIAAVVAASLLLASCSTYVAPEARPYQSYGPFNEGTYKSEKVCYEVSGWSVFWGIILIETLIGPIYFFGYDLYNPVRLKKGPEDRCASADG